MDSGRVADRGLKLGFILGRRGRFWESHKKMFKIGVYSGRKGSILRGP